MESDPKLAPLLESAGRFAAAARKFLAELKDCGPSSSGQAARNFGDFLRAEALAFLRSPWSAERDPLGSTAFSIGDLPALGRDREHQLRGQRTAEIAGRIFDAQLKLQLMWSDALREAALAFAERLSTSQRGAARVGAPDAGWLREAYGAWIDCAEEGYARMAHSDSFSSALGEFMNASSAWRTEARASSELCAKALDLPTRSEVNSLLRRVNSLEAQLRSMSLLRRVSSLEEQLHSKEARRPPAAKRAKRPRP